MYRFGGTLIPRRLLVKVRSFKETDKQFYRYNSLGLPKLQQADCSDDSVENIYQRWLKDPSSVENRWNTFFQRISRGGNDAAASNPSPRSYNQERSYASGSADSKVVNDSIEVTEMIRRFQTKGYLLAKLDPLELCGSTERMAHVIPENMPFKHIKDEHVRLLQELKSEVKDDQVFKLPSDTFIGGSETSLPLKEIIKRLEETYCGSTGIEFAHMHSVEQCNWLKKKFEPPGATKISNDQRRLTLARLIRTSWLERYFNKKFPSVKRFSAGGAEVMAPCLKQIIDKSTEFGVEFVGMSMAHRGRTNLLANVCRQSLDQLFAQFGNLDVQDPFEGDVKYHSGLCIDKLNKVTNKNIRIILVANPSHLECSTPVLMGRIRAEQFFRGDKNGRKTIGIVIHGDSAMCGQGVTYETIQFSDIPSFTTYGSVHVVLNNQLGFTTNPLDARSSSYPTDVGKIVNAPVIHVNGHDPEAVIHAANVAAEWRATWRKDIFLDILLYRVLGHNEGDEPMLTQPRMYTKIRQTKPILELYSEKLISEGIVTTKEVEETAQRYEKVIEAAFEESKKHKFFDPTFWNDCPWPENTFKDQKQEIPATGVSDDVLQHILKAHAGGAPQGFVTHKSLERIMKGRQELIKNKLVDFSLAEACAFGSLLKEGIHVRACGQDFQRGTFSHRHYVIHHQTMDSTYIPLANLWPDQAVFSPINSCLSEYAVLGFEWGYSQCNPKCLCVWEAQFGDFQNTAQCMFDCFICNAEAKWVKKSGLVMNLPHGLEGMGADHSSARPERFLAMCTDDPTKVVTSEGVFQQMRDCNWIVAQVTTPANLFHIYRRQMHMPFRKPLINFFPKSLLRLPVARSPIDEIKEGTYFQRVISDPVDPAGVNKVSFSVGKVYYDLLRARHAKKLDKEIALVRIEQVSPFPYDLVAAEIAKYPNAKIIFVQEEHINHGYNHFVMPRLQKLLPGKEIKLISRGPGAGGAAAFPKAHQRQLVKLLEEFIKA